MNSEVNYISSIESADEVTLTAAEIALKLSKYARGEEAFYQLEHLGGAYYNAPMMEFEVVDGKISPLNWGSYKRYLSIQGGYDTVYPMVDNSSFEGDEAGGKFTFAYDYHEYYYSSTSETGTMTFVWGTYAVEKFVPEYTTDPADGSVINDAVDEAYLQFSGYCDIMYTDKAQIVVKDAEGNEVNTNAYFEYNYGDYSKIRISYLGLTESGTYTITVKGNSLTVSTNYLSYKTVTGDVSFTITVERVWDGSVVLPETVASTDELLSIPVTFPYAEQVSLTNFGVVGAVFSEGGDVFALLFPDTYTGEVEIDGSTVNVRFEKMSDLRAQNAALAETLAQRVAGFVQPEIGKATVYISPKSFKVNGAIYQESISKTYEVAGSGQSTGIETLEISGENAVVYNLQGRRIAPAAKGIVIRNGVKIIK